MYVNCGFSKDMFECIHFLNYYCTNEFFLSKNESRFLLSAWTDSLFFCLEKGTEYGLCHLPSSTSNVPGGARYPVKKDLILYTLT